MKTKKLDKFGHERTCYIIADKIILPAKYFGHKADFAFKKYAISNGAYIETYKDTLQEAKNFILK